MDFIEQIFGISPDGGSGATEALLFATPIVLLAFWRLRRARTTPGFGKWRNRQ
jgi:hypothetical protein